MSGVGVRAGYRGRFAPSPSGWLHLGNARTALLAWLRARSSGGALVMRVEDLDGPRTVPGAVAGNLHELRWLGLDWDEGPDRGGPFGPYRQSERGEHYTAALGRLRAAGLVAPCYLSRRDLRELARAPHGPAPVYGPRERRRNDRIAARRRVEGKVPSLRVRLPPGDIRFDDLLAGAQRFEVRRDVGDIVVRRADGIWAYHLAVVVDDAAMGVREVVRGDDLLPATAAQLALYRALELEPPAYLHVPLLHDATGQRMAKRRGSLTLHALAHAGADPHRVVGLLAHSLGLIPEPRPSTPAALVPDFTVAAVRRDPDRLDRARLAWMLVGADATLVEHGADG